MPGARRFIYGWRRHATDWLTPPIADAVARHRSCSAARMAMVARHSCWQQFICRRLATDAEAGPP